MSSSPELSRCEICARTFKRLSDLARHTRNQHGEGKTTCEVCRRQLRSDAYAEHLRKTHGVQKRSTATSDLSGLTDTPDDSQTIQQEKAPKPSYTMSSLDSPVDAPLKQIEGQIVSYSGEVSLQTMWSLLRAARPQPPRSNPQAHQSPYQGTEPKALVQRLWCLLPVQGRSKLSLQVRRI